MGWAKYRNVATFEAGSALLAWDGRVFVLSVLQHRRRVFVASGRLRDWRRLCVLRAEMNGLDGEALWMFIASGKMMGRISPGTCLTKAKRPLGFTKSAA
jgi:hypothetical protein